MLTKQAAHRKDLRTYAAHMEHRHFATIATIIRGMDIRDGMLPADRKRIAEIFVRTLRHTNPNFSESRFMAACLSKED